MSLILVPALTEAQVQTIAPAAAAREDIAKTVGACRLVAKVETPRQAELATDACRKAKRLLADIEDARARAKSPFWNAGTSIDKLARELSADLAKHVKRLESALSLFLQAQKRIADEAEAEQRRARQREIDAANAEAERIRTAAAAAAPSAPTPAGQQSLIDLGEANARRVVAQAARSVVPVSVVPTVPSGVAAKPKWNYRVTDIWAVATENRNLVRIEPHLGNIRQMIDDGMRECPGLEIFEETNAKVSTR